MTQEIRDHSGRCIARVQNLGNVIAYMTPGGQVFARVQNGKTYDHAGRFIGPGDVALLLLRR